jgi:hypothetical protein
MAKLSSEFQLLRFLEIRRSMALRLLERAVAMAAPGTLVEVIQITPDPEAELGVAVRPVPFVAGMPYGRPQRERRAITSDDDGRRSR